MSEQLTATRFNRLHSVLLAFVLCSCACAALGRDDGEALATAGGALQLAGLECEIAPRLARPDWRFSGARGAVAPDADGSYSFRLEAGSGAIIFGKAAFYQRDDGGVEAVYTFTPEQDVELNALFAGVSLPASVLAGGTWSSDTPARSGDFPVVPGPAAVYAGETRRVSITAADGRRKLTFSFPTPVSVLLQDDRQWGPSFSVRLGHSGPTRTFAAGEPFEVRFTVDTHESLRLDFDHPVTLEAGRDWIAFEDEKDIVPGSALDFSALGFTDAPAGRHGWVVAEGPHFEFERKPGVPQRFYGVNLCFSANFLEPRDSERLAERLARIGYNALRLHHHDGGLVSGSADGTTLNPEQLARLDALVAACIEQGIYLTTDLYVSRPVPWRGIGVDRDGNIPMNDFKLLLPVHEGAWENLKSFSRQWFNHVNPHTGRSLAEEPAMAWICLVNEGNYGNFMGQLRRMPEWLSAWREWLEIKKTEEPEAFEGIDADTLPENTHGRDRQTAAVMLFLADMEARFFERVRDFLRDELGSRALLTNQNGWTHHATDQIPRHSLYDYVDDHFYVDHPQFLEHSWRLPSRCDNRNPIRNDAMGAQGVVFTRLLDKPFTISEYNYSGPGRFRGVGGIVTGAMGALQDWAGIWRFAFSHNSDAISRDSPVRMGYFDMAGDPLSLAAERATLCLFLRGDLAPLERRYALLIPEEAATRMRSSLPRNRTAWAWLAWYARLGTQVSDSPLADADWTGNFPEAYDASSAEIRELLSDPSGELPPAGDGSVMLDSESGTFVITTPRTSGGFSEEGVVQAGALVFDVGDVAATVWVSSLDDQPIPLSSRLLLTHLTDVQNTGIRYAQRSRQTLLDWGRLPHLARNGRAEVRLTVEAPDKFRVYALSTGGRRIASIPTSIEGEQLVFLAAVDAVPGTASMLYEIIKEET